MDVTPDTGRPDDWPRLWLALLAVSGIAMAAGAFLPWIDFGFFTVAGTDVPGALPGNDGHAVAALGLAVVLLTGLAVLVRPLRTLALLLVCASATAAFAIALTDVMADWQNQSCGGVTVHDRINLICRGSVTLHGFTVKGTPAPALWLVTGASAFAALLSLFAAVRGFFPAPASSPPREGEAWA